MTTESKQEAKTDDKDEDEDVAHIQDKSQYDFQYDERARDNNIYFESSPSLKQQQLQLVQQADDELYPSKGNPQKDKPKITRQILSKKERMKKWKQEKEKWKLSQGSWRVFITSFKKYFIEKGQQKYISEYKVKYSEQPNPMNWQLMKKRIQSTVRNRKGGSNPRANNHLDLYSLLVYTRQAHKFETQFMIAICQQYQTTAFKTDYQIAKKQKKRISKEEKGVEIENEKNDGIEQQDDDSSTITDKIGIFLNTIQKQQNKSLEYCNKKFPIQQVLNL